MTPQQHYDWGLRALKTVLRGSGNLLRQLKKNGTKQDGMIDYLKYLILKVCFNLEFFILLKGLQMRTISVKLNEFCLFLTSLSSVMYLSQLIEQFCCVFVN